MRRLSRPITIAIVCLLLITVGLPATSLAAPAAQGGDNGLLINGAIVNITLKPGQTVVHHMVVGSGQHAPPMDIQIAADGFGQSLNGSFVPVAADQDQSPYSARTFITAIDKPTFHLDPGGSVPVAVTIAAPADLGANTRYALVYVSSKPVDNGAGVGQILAASIPVVITPAGAQLNRTGQVKDVVVKPVTAGQPIEVSATVVNTGNRHYKVQGQVVISDASGRTVATLPIGLTATSIIPTFAQQLTVSYSALDRPQGLAAGAYTAEVQVQMDDGTPLESMQASFQVTQPYQLCADVDASHSVIVSFANEVPTAIRGQGKTDVDLTLQDTGAITGQAAICQYLHEPAGTPAFEASLDAGGTGASGLKFALIGVAGFNVGVAQLAVHYQTGELGALDPNSLFLAFRDGPVWHKLDHLAVQTGAGVVLGELPVSVLTKGQLVALGGAGGPAAAQPAAAPDWLALWPAIVGAVLVAVLLSGGVVWVVRRLGRGDGASP